MGNEQEICENGRGFSCLLRFISKTTLCNQFVFEMCGKYLPPLLLPIVYQTTKLFKRNKWQQSEISLGCLGGKKMHR